jgi:hypothetical protein
MSMNAVIIRITSFPMSVLRFATGYREGNREAGGFGVPEGARPEISPGRPAEDTAK